MASSKLALVGGVVGFHHTPGAYLLTQGRSLHPMQRQGSVSHSGFASVPAAFIGGAGHGPPVGVGPDLGYPATLMPGRALMPAVRV